MKGNLWWVAILVIVAVVGLLAVPAAIADQAVSTTVEDEQHTLQSDDAVTLDAADEWYRMIEESEIVEDAENGTIYERGEDYEIDYDAGNVTAINNSEADGEDVLIDYEYETVDETTEDIAGLLGIVDPLIPMIVIVGMVGALMSLLGWL